MNANISNFFQSVKAIIFDFDGTLDGNGINWIDRIYQQFVRGGLSIDYIKILQAGDKALKILDSDVGSKELSYAKTIEIFIYWIIKNLDIIIENYRNVLVQPFMESTKTTIGIIKDTLAKLAKKYPLAIISNSFGNCHGWCRELGIAEYFTFIIDSGLVGTKKPDLKIFKLALQEFGYKANECAYIGDNLNHDILIPMQLGMKVIWLSNQKINTLPKKNYIKVNDFKQIEKLWI